MSQLCCTLQFLYRPLLYPVYILQCSFLSSLGLVFQYDRREDVSRSLQLRHWHGHPNRWSSRLHPAPLSAASTAAELPRPTGLYTALEGLA